MLNGNAKNLADENQHFLGILTQALCHSDEGVRKEGAAMFAAMKKCFGEKANEDVVRTWMHA